MLVPNVAQQKVKDSIARMLPMIRPRMMDFAEQPHATSVAPITNSCCSDMLAAVQTEEVADAGQILF